MHSAHTRTRLTFSLRVRGCIVRRRSANPWPSIKRQDAHIWPGSMFSLSLGRAGLIARAAAGVDDV